jgi:hypothetical protein
MNDANGKVPPTADTVAIRDEWIAAVNELVARVEGWCKEMEWATRRAPKRIEEESLGKYEVPMLLMQQWDVRLLMDPVGRTIVGAAGRVDFYVLPQYDDLAVLYRNDDGEWLMSVETGLPDNESPFTRDSFKDVVETLVKRHAETR